ncbi:MAG: sugar kinase [Pseudomonadota bacterium]
MCCIGEAMMELQAGAVPGPAQVGFAGDTLNAAVYMRRALATQHDVAFVTAVGTDALSDQLVAFIASHGIETDTIARIPDRHLGLYSINVDAAGERSFTYWRNQSAARQMFDPDIGLSFEHLNAFDLIYLSGITLAILPPPVRSAFLDWIAQFRAAGGAFAFDTNYRPGLWETPEVARRTCDRAWRICDVALPSLDDEMALFEQSEDQVIARFQTYSAQGALKRGERGPSLLNWQPASDLVFTPADYVRDTTAAGDSFSGTYIAEWISTGDIGWAIERAHAVARVVVTQPGAIVDLNCGSF